MKELKTALGFGFLVWLIPFIVAFLLFPVRSSLRVLFESIMPAVLTLCAVLFSTLYLKKIRTNFLGEGIQTGLLWLAMSLGLDLLMFSWGPMKMTLVDYVMDIGITYLILPTVTIGSAYLLEGKLK